MKNAYIHGERDIVGLNDKEVEAITRDWSPCWQGFERCPRRRCKNAVPGLSLIAERTLTMASTATAKQIERAALLQQGAALERTLPIKYKVLSVILPAKRRNVKHSCHRPIGL